jgi:LysR family hydrogen peroxide-inducible transcriptional activator
VDRSPLTRLPSLRNLRYLVALAEHLNFRAAADACFVSQSTLSAGIKELESGLGVRLVERDTRSVRLTRIGAETTARARRILGEAADLVAAAGEAREPLSGALRLGVIPTIAPYLLPRVLAPLRARHPKLRLYLREDLTEHLLERVRSGELDVALIALPYDTAELATRELFRDEFWFVAPPDEPLARARAVAVDRIDASEVILLEDGHCLREHAIAACERARGEPSRIEATSLPTLLQMVEGGLGVTLLPEIALKGGALNGTRLVARPFASRVPARTIAFASRPNGTLGRDLDLLAELIARYASPTRPGIPSRRRSRARG